MNPTVVQSDKVRSEQVGAIRIEYANLFNNVSDSRPILMIVADMIWPFLATGQGNALSGISQRV
jgi:hypothetical protein